MQTLRRLVWGVVGAVLVSGLWSPAQGAADIATLRKEAERLTRELRRAEQEVSFTETTMTRLDQDIEERITVLVDQIAKSKDSAVTDKRVEVCRRSAVAGLRRVIALYAAERERRRQNGWDTSRINERIDRRLAEMAKIAATFGPEEEVEQVKSTSVLDDMWMDGALKDMKAAKYMGAEVQTREDMVKELEAVVQFLTSRRDTLKLQLEVTTDAAEKEKLQQAIEEAETLADKRREQAAELLAAPDPEKGAAAAGVDSASALERALRDGRTVLRTKFMDLQKLATTRDYQQKRADYARKQLAETKAAIEQLEKAQ